MNAVEIEQAITDLAERPFDPVEFPFAFLEAFGNKEASLKKLRTGASNKSDIGGVLQVNNIHILVGGTLDTLRHSPAILAGFSELHCGPVWPDRQHLP